MITKIMKTNSEESIAMALVHVSEHNGNEYNSTILTVVQYHKNMPLLLEYKG